MYNAIAVYRTQANLYTHEKSSRSSELIHLIMSNSRVYIDKIVRDWGRISFVQHKDSASGELIHNGNWINLEKDHVALIWAKGRNIDKRQQVSLQNSL